MHRPDCLPVVLRRILATKWVAGSYVRAFRAALERLDHSGGSARFLLIDPESEGYRRFRGVRWSEGGVQPVSMLRSLSAAHPSFEVRLYDALPTFRIVLIDQSVVSSSPSHDPWHAAGQDRLEEPHIVLDRTAPGRWPRPLRPSSRGPGGPPRRSPRSDGSPWIS